MNTGDQPASCAARPGLAAAVRAYLAEIDDAPGIESASYFEGLDVYRDRVSAARMKLRASLAADDAVGNDWRFGLGQRVRKWRGAEWQGLIVGFYSASLTSRGYAVESERELGNVQIYPEVALEAVPEAPPASEAGDA